MRLVQKHHENVTKTSETSRTYSQSPHSKITSDLLLQTPDESWLVLFDLSAAFHSISQTILLRQRFDWFHFGQKQFINMGDAPSPSSPVSQGVSQGSVLGFLQLHVKSNFTHMILRVTTPPSPWGTAWLYKSAKTQQQQHWAPGCCPQTLLRKVGAFLLDINGVFHLPVFRSLKPWSYPSNQMLNILQHLPFSVKKHPKPLSYTSWLSGRNPHSRLHHLLFGLLQWVWCGMPKALDMSHFIMFKTLLPEFSPAPSLGTTPAFTRHHQSFQLGLGFITKFFSPTGHCTTCCTFALHPGTSGVLMLDCSLSLCSSLQTTNLSWENSELRQTISLQIFTLHLQLY